MAKHLQRASEAAVIDSLEGGDGDETPRPAPIHTQGPRIKGRLTEARIVDQRHRAADYPGSVRFRIRALGGEHEACYVVAPIGPDAAVLARAEYLRALSLDGATLPGVVVKPMPD